MMVAKYAIGCRKETGKVSVPRKQSEVLFRNMKRTIRLVSHQSHHEAASAKHHVVFIIHLFNSTNFTFDLGAITNTNIKKKNWVEQGVNYFFERIIAIMAAVAGSVAVLMMSIGGFRMIASAGDETAYKNGRSMIVRSAIGLVFVLGAYLLVVTVQLLIKSIYGG